MSNIALDALKAIVTASQLIFCLFSGAAFLMVFWWLGDIVLDIARHWGV